MENLKLKFDAMTSHDITFVGVIQTAKASGMEKFPLPYVLTNCHNSLCAVGGTINEDDHMFGLSAAKKYGGIDVMTTETTCLTSIWRTDGDTKAFLTEHKRGGEYKELNPAAVAYYDGCVCVDLSTVKPMIALPFHPSNTCEIDELNANPGDILREVEKAAEKVSGGRTPTP